MGVAYLAVKKYRRPIYKKVRKAARDYFWNGFIRSTSLTYLKSFVAMILSLKLLNMKGIDPSIIVTLLILLQLLIFPQWAAYFMIQNKENLIN